MTHLVPLYCNYIKPCRSIGYFMCRHILLSASVQSFLLFCIHCFQRTARTFCFAGISLHRIPNTPCPWQSDRSPLPDTCSYTPGSEIPSFLKICRQSAHRQCRQLCCFVSSFSHCARKTPHFSDKIFNKGTAVNRRRSKFPKCCDMRCRAISLIVSKPVSRKYLIILFHQTVSCYFRNYTCGRN